MARYRLSGEICDSVRTNLTSKDRFSTGYEHPPESLTSACTSLGSCPAEPIATLSFLAQYTFSATWSSALTVRIVSPAVEVGDAREMARRDERAEGVPGSTLSRSEARSE
jgi:hypothetical protein